MENNNCIFSGSLKGTSFEPAKSNLQALLTPFLANLEVTERGKLLSELVIELTHIKDNPYDPNAIRVTFHINDMHWEVGWIPKFINTKILEVGLDNVECKLQDFNIYEEKIVGALIKVLKKP
jgi:hypothetical protein